MNHRKLRKLQRAYAKLIAYDHEPCEEEYLNEAQELLRQALGKRACREAEGWVEAEYAASGMEA
jgi:hypothetical protein